MLYDKGLATDEDRKLMADVAEHRLNGGGGCLDRAICHNCNHVVVDSTCLCSGVFQCPHCKAENPKNRPSMWPTLEGRLNAAPATELEALQQLERSIPLSPAGKARLKKLLDNQSTVS